MALKDTITSGVQAALSDKWNARDGRVVPTTASIVAAGGRVDMTVAMLYADLADSTKLAIAQPLPAARLFKAYLASAARLIGAQGGDIRSFDGDRIMAVFAGETPRSDAVRAAFHINWAFAEVIKPAFTKTYGGVFTPGGAHKLGHAVGVDYGKISVVRAGIRDNSDLVWVGRAPNVAAKLSGVRDGGYSIFITPEVFDGMLSDLKTSSGGVGMWEKRAWTNGAVPELYRSSWWRSP